MILKVKEMGKKILSQAVVRLYAAILTYLSQANQYYGRSVLGTLIRNKPDRLNYRLIWYLAQMTHGFMHSANAAAAVFLNKILEEENEVHPQAAIAGAMSRS